MPQHHPDPSTVLAYAAGSLPTAFAAVLAAHLEVCPSCRAAVRDAERAGARLVEQQDGAALSPGARDALRARLGGTAMAPRPLLHESTPVHDPDLLPRPLQPFFGPRYSTLRWRRVVDDLLDSLDQRVVLVTHDLAAAERAERVLVVDDGRVVADADGPGGVAAYRDLMARAG